MRKFLCALSFVAVAVIGCKKEGGETAPTTGEAKQEMMAEGEKKEMAAETDTAGQPAAGEAAEAPAAEQIGVAECDQYIAKMTQCLDKMPEESRAASKTALEQATTAWKQAAATEEGKAGLVNACKASLDALAQNPACG